MKRMQPRVVPYSSTLFWGWRERLIAAWRWRGTKLLLTAAMLAAICTAADWRSVGQALLTLDMRWMAAALAMFGAQSLVSALRWQRQVREIAPISLAEAARHTLAASACNLLMPAKLGDLSKAAMLPITHTESIGRAARAVIVEKVFDVAALCGLMLWGAVGLGYGSSLSIGCLLALGAWRELATRARPRWRPMVGYSLLLWSLHLVQIDFFLKAAGVFVASDVALARVPLAIFAGLLPLSFCGIGTRDTALIWLFADVAPASTMAVVGLLTALRYIIPGLAGVFVIAWSRRSEAESIVFVARVEPVKRQRRTLKAKKSKQAKIG